MLWNSYSNRLARAAFSYNITNSILDGYYYVDILSVFNERLLFGAKTGHGIYMCTEPFVNGDNCTKYDPIESDDGDFTRSVTEAKLVGSCNECVAYICHKQAGGNGLIIGTNSTERFEHDITDLLTSKLCHLNVADDGNFVIVTNCERRNIDISKSGKNVYKT
jgi:hypothetical protein